MRHFAALIILLATACSAEPETPPFPYFEEEGGRVRDGAGIIAPDLERQLTSMLEAATSDYGQQMAIVTVDDLHGYDIADFSVEYARAWKLGDASRNDGLLLLVAPNERKVRIEVGYGLENSFSDEFCAEVLREKVLPRFTEGNFEAGIVDGTNAMIEKMRQVPSRPANDNDAPAGMAQEDAA